MSEHLTTRLFFAAFIAGALFDLLVEVFGLALLLRTTDIFSAFVCMTLAFICFCLRFGTPRILASPRDRLGFILRGAWGLAVVVSFLALASAIGVHALAKQPIDVTIGVSAWDAWAATPWPGQFIGAVLVLYLAAAPLLLAYLMREHGGRAKARPQTAS